MLLVDIRSHCEHVTGYVFHLLPRSGKIAISQEWGKKSTSDVVKSKVSVLGIIQARKLNLSIPPF